MTITPTSVTRRHERHRHSVPERSGACRRNLCHARYEQLRPLLSVPGIVSVPGGQTSASFTVTTFAVGNNTSVTITAFFDTTTSANLTVTAGAPPPFAHTSGLAYTAAASPIHRRGRGPPGFPTPGPRLRRR